MINDADARRLWGKRTHQLLPYVPGEQPRDRTFIKLNTNENPYPPAPEVQNVIRAYPADRFRLYPDPGSRQLRSVLAGYLGVSENQIFVGNGSDEVLAIAFQAFFNSRAAIAAAGFGSAGIADGAVVESECIVFPDVTYSFYPVYARMYDIPFRTIPLDEGFNVPLDACTAPSAGLVLANPNAPTGIALSLEAIGKLADSDRNRLVMVDEAYVDFGAESAIELLETYDNILVVQTCSKSRSLAGLRVGYAVGAPGLVEALERVRDSFNSYTLDSLAQVAAIAAISAGDWFEQNRARIISTRERASQTLAELGFQVLPSSANFLFVRHPDYDAEKLYQQLRLAGILVRHFRQPRIENFLRITIGTDEEMDTLAQVLRELL